LVRQLSPQASPSDLDRSGNTSNVSGGGSSSKRSLDALLTASSPSTAPTMAMSPVAAASLFDCSVLLNPPLSPAAAASLSPVEKVSLKQKLQKDLEWTQLMLQQRLLFLKQQQQQAPQ
jgi:hypothetical protein